MKNSKLCPSLGLSFVCTILSPHNEKDGPPADNRRSVFLVYHCAAPHSLRFFGECTLQLTQQCLALLGHGLKRPLLKGRAQSSLLEKLCKDLLPTLGKEAYIAVKCVIIILARGQQEL